MTRRTRPEPIAFLAYASPCERVRIERLAGEFYLYLDGSFYGVYATCAAAEVEALVWLETQAPALPPLPADDLVVEALASLETSRPAGRFDHAAKLVKAGIMAGVEERDGAWMVPSQRAGEAPHRIEGGRCGCPAGVHRGHCWALALVEGIELAREWVVDSRDAVAA
jgi:hypothetical protein